ncbi:MAG TPA: DNA-binding domain-containing protein [Burkholderiales bacterium]
MPSLPEIQRAFARAVFGEPAPDLTACIVAAGLEPARRVEIYRNNVYSTLCGALRDSYPVVVKLVGREFFDQVAREFVTTHPSTSGDLHDFGGEWAEFLAGHPACRGLPYLPDVARLEWTCDRVFHAADHPGLAFERLAAIEPDAYAGLRFQLHPASGLVASPYPILRIWQINQDGWSGDPSVSLDQGGARVLVTRNEFALELEALPPGEFAFLDSLSRGETLSHAVSAATAEEAEFDLQQALRHGLARRVIVDFRVSA